MIRSKKYLYILLGFLLFLLLLNFGITLWVEYKLAKISNKENDSDYTISYKDIDLSIWNSSIEIKDIMVVPKTHVENTKEKLGIYANVSKIEIDDFDVWSILFGKKIKAEKLTISKPDIILYKNNKKPINNAKSINNKVVKPFEKIIIVSDVFLNQGNIKIVNNITKEVLTSVTNIHLKVEGIVLNEETLEQKIPFNYQSYSVVCDSAFYHIDAFYKVTLKKLSTTDTALNITNLKLVPKFSRQEFVQMIPKEKDLYTISAEDLSIKRMEWKFENDIFSFKTDAIVINTLDANIYRGKMPEDDLSKKKLYNSLLRELPFNLKVGRLQIINSKVVYEEEKSFKEGAGKLSFTDFDMTVLNLQSGYKKEKLADTKIKVKCIFMKESELDVDWSFNVMDETDGFKIKGNIFNFDAAEMEYFTKPYMNVIVKGDLDQVYFNFAGNDFSNKGDFALKYDDLKVEIFRNKERQKINKFLSAVANLFIKDDSGEELKSTTIEVVCTQEKSFYNLLWISIAEGLKKLLL